MMTTANDQRYQLSRLMIEELRSTNKFKVIHNQIINNGHSTVNNGGKVAKIFTAELSYLLFSTDIKLFNLDKQIEENINTFNYLKIFVEAFQQGEKYFESEFKVTTSTIYGDNSEMYLKDIHDNYFHTEHLPLHKGWHFVKNSFPFIITEKAIFNFGYYSGIVAKADQLFDKYSNVFDKVRTCESDTSSLEKYRPFYQQRQFTDSANKLNDDKTQNTNFLPTIIYDWKESINKTVDENTTLTPEVKEKLKSYNWKIYDLIKEIIQLYKGVNNSDNNKIDIHQSRIKYRLTTIIDFAEIVTFYELKDDFSSATKIKKHCLMILKNGIDNLKDVYSIDILKTPLQTDIEAVNEALNNSINIDEVVKLQGLNNAIKEPQKKDIIIDEVIINKPKKELHNNIFVGNSFEVWQSMFDEFDIKESSRSDVKFMFEIMRSKGENLIHKTVNQKSFLEWITDTYDGLIVEKISNYSKTKSRLNAYSRAKELYKK